MKIKIETKGSFQKTENFLKRALKLDLKSKLERLGQQGVEALASATPADTGLTAKSWSYEIEITDDYCAIYWTNNNVVDDWYYVAAGIQYGHETGTGGWVEGIDYINPALKPIFDGITNEIWYEIERF